MEPTNSGNALAGSLKDSGAVAPTARRDREIGQGAGNGRLTLKRPCVRSRESLRPYHGSERHAGQATGRIPGSGGGGVKAADRWGIRQKRITQNKGDLRLPPGFRQAYESEEFA